jgi:hypothetical protein
MKRLLAITLTLLFGWAFIAPVLPALVPSIFASALAGDANLPACCRRSGKHHCMMGRAAGASPSSGPTAAQLAEKCPYQPGAVVAPQPSFFSTHDMQSTPTPLFQRPAPVSQAEASYRIAASRSHQKRGPPTIL